MWIVRDGRRVFRHDNALVRPTSHKSSVGCDRGRESPTQTATVLSSFEPGVTGNPPLKMPCFDGFSAFHPAGMPV